MCFCQHQYHGDVSLYINENFRSLVTLSVEVVRRMVMAAQPAADLIGCIVLYRTVT